MKKCGKRAMHCSVCLSQNQTAQSKSLRRCFTLSSIPSTIWVGCSGPHNWRLWFPLISLLVAQISKFGLVVYWGWASSNLRIYHAPWCIHHMENAFAEQRSCQLLLSLLSRRDISIKPLMNYLQQILFWHSLIVLEARLYHRLPESLVGTVFKIVFFTPFLLLRVMHLQDEILEQVLGQWCGYP